MLQAIRKFFIKNHYLEVETPQLISGPLPEVHIDAVSTSVGYLQTSPEMCMKQILAAGYPKIFQISRCFRANERGDRHLPEFCLLEWYRSGIDYHDLMQELKDLIRWVLNGLDMTGKIQYQGMEMDVREAWVKFSVGEAFDRFASMSLVHALGKNCFDDVMVKEIEPCLAPFGAVFLYDYPASMASMARLKPNAPELAERFEMYIFGLELANGFSELNDAHEQRARFEKERKRRSALGKDPYPVPERFLDCLDHMPDAAGVAVGLDRLAMILADRPTIDDVVFFTPEEA